MPFLTAIVVAAVLVLLVLQRDKVMEFAGRSSDDTAVAVETSETTAAEAPDTRVSVVARKSVAQPVDNAVLVRGRTEAARQVDVRAETAGAVISEPLRRGAMVTAGQMLCQIDPGTREVALAEAEARLAEAAARLPAAEATLAEAQARLDEALINDRVASQLKKDGFASETRVASTAASVSSARAGILAANSGLEGAESGIRAAEAAVAAAKKEIERLTIKAPFAGLLESDSAEIGSFLTTGGTCATVIQLDPVKIVGFLAETDVDRVTTDSLVGARLASGREVVGKVSFVSRAADSSTRTFRVEATIPNPDLAIRDGQTADMIISTGGVDAHLVPQSALTLNDNGVIGVRIVTEGAAAFAAIEVLRDTPEGVWVGGLPEQVEVIVVGQEFVTDGVPVKVSYQEYGQ
ncbi:efflux RND transporter periplasmic adaptor subunit [Actibacterium pelagium]